jgi:cell division protease FtsH
MANQNRPTEPSRDRIPRPAIPHWGWWIAFALLLAWNVATFILPHGSPIVALSYSAFLKQVDLGNVERVTISGQSADGQLKPIGPAPSSTPSSAATPGQPAQTLAPIQFTAILPTTNDAVLVSSLASKGVDVTVVDVSRGSWVLTLLASVLPVVLLVVVMMYIGRQIQKTSQGALGFGRSKARLYDIERPPVTFADVAGEDEAKGELTEVVGFLKNPKPYHVVGARLPHGVLLVGPPGTGKTLLARAVAGEAKVPFFSISASEFVEMFVGVGASRVRDLFTQAKANSPSIVFVDEIDAVGRQRGAGLGGGNDEREQTLNQLLVAMDGFDERQEVVVIAATNRADVLDPALLRPGRFDRQVTVGLPDRAGRVQILGVHVRGKPLYQDVDLNVLARQTPGFSGADLANLANEAAMMAATAGRVQISRLDFASALDKIILGVERPHLQSEEERRLVAFHEAGHALVAVCTPGADPLQKVTIIPRGRALGVTELLPTEDRLNFSRSYLLGRLAVMLGGRAAEEVVFEEPTTGAESDLASATKLARRMVGSWGMVDSIGPVHLDDASGNVFLGRDLVQTRSYSEETGAKLDEAVADLIEQARAQATTLIAGHRSQLDAIVKQLLEHETIGGDEIRRIVGEIAPSPRRSLRAAAVA